jgi:NitT/TauT family transport system substrate-binding protein
MRLSEATDLAPGRRRLRLIAAVFAGFVPLLVITGCDPFHGLSSQSSSETITVAADPGIENANLYLAVRDGYFTRAGVTVKIQRYTSVKSELTALNNGSVDVISADYGDIFVAAVQSSHPIYRILADGYDAGPGITEILTLPDSPIKSPDDLAGKKIPVPDAEEVPVPAGDPNTLTLASAVSVLQSDGVNLAAVDWEPMRQTRAISELIHKQVPAILVSGINVYLAQQAGAVELIDACSGPTAGIPLDGFVASSSWLSEANNAAAAKAFTKGLYAADAAATMPGPIQAVLPKWMHISKQQADLVTTGTYPLSTITANLYRTAALLWNVGTTKLEVDVAKLVFG